MAYKSTDPKRKAKLKEHISEYERCKVLVEMTKEKSIFTVKIFENELDEFLIHPVRYRTKSGLVSESFIVLAPELGRWVQIYEKEGFKKA